MNEATEFTNLLNQNSWGIKFTQNFSETEIPFLDLNIGHNNEIFITFTYFKTVDLNFSSGHHNKLKKNVPCGQFRRVRKNCSEDETFEAQAEINSKRFLEKGYPKKLIKDAFTKAKSINQTECLEIRGKNQEESITFANYTKFITTYNRSHITIQNTLKKYWYILQRDPHLKSTLPKKPTSHI